MVHKHLGSFEITENLVESNEYEVVARIRSLAAMFFLRRALKM
jgi:hypothetical protein